MGRFNGRLINSEPAMLQLPGKLDDQDRILTGKSHKDDKADLGEDIVITLCKPHTRDGGEQPHRYNQKHCQGKDDTFVLGREDEENQQHGKR